MGVAPLVERGKAGAAAALGVEEDVRDAEAEEALEEGLLEVGVGAEGGRLDDGGVLEVVADEDDALETGGGGGFVCVAGTGGVLHDEGDEAFGFGDLRGFFHDHVVVFEAQVRDLLPSHRRVGGCHGDDPSLLHQ